MPVLNLALAVIDGFSGRVRHLVHYCRLVACSSAIIVRKQRRLSELRNFDRKMGPTTSTWDGTIGFLQNTHPS
jgi:hypothetical protein